MSDKPRPNEPATSGLGSTEKWQGWAELENDPAIFSTLLREWGVPNVRIQEVFELDLLFNEETDPILGLVLLSRWISPEDASDHQLTTAPAALWFANQVSSYSCATVAIMNIVNNHADITLGTEMNAFRDRTKSMSPKDRGLALDSFEHIRNKHNSFATEIDKMSVDVSLKGDALRYERKKKEAAERAPQGRRRKRRKVTMDADYNENGFHFIAYAPAIGSIWKMDGMEPSPRKIGDVAESGGWLFAAIGDLQSQMQSAQTNDMEFSLLSLVHSTTTEDSTTDATDIQRAREDWGPFISHMVRLHAEKGDIREMMQ